MIKVIIVDDHPLFIMGLKSTLLKDQNSDIVISGEAESGEELFDLLKYTLPDLILLDINLPGIGGIETAKRLRKDYPSIKILAISAENTAETIKAMIDVGIDGFISKRKSGIEELVEAVHSVMNGLEYFGRDISAIIFDIFVAKKQTSVVSSEFTEREKEIILACRDGQLSKEIATKLGISVNTVNTHKQRIFQKLGINNTMEMVQYALKNGIIRVG